MKKKTPKKKLKKTAGRTPETRKQIDNKLLELFNEGGITHGHAGELARCSRQYASEKFKKFGDEIQASQPVYESWVMKNDRVRDRALEGLSRNVKNCDDTIQELKKRLKEAQSVQTEIFPETANKVQDTELGEALKHITAKTLFAIYKFLSTDMNMWKNYGYYVETISNNLRAETILKAEFQQQFDTIEILPPATEILDREIEKRIAEKQNLKAIDLQTQMIANSKKT